METLAESLFRICYFLLRILLVLFVLLIPWFFITLSSGFMTMQGDIMPGADLVKNLSLMGLIMAVFYLPLCSFIKSLFPSIISGEHRNCEKLVILMFYIFIVATYIPMINESIAYPIGAKQSEAKQYVSSMNKGQQAYYAEKSVFSTSIEALGLGLKTETTNYKYSWRATKQTAFNYGVSKEPQLKSYVGGVFRVPAKEVDPNAAKDEIKTILILCQADSPGAIKPAEPTYENGEGVCGKGTTQVTK
jgi:type IV pilus assembly protein PilA